MGRLLPIAAGSLLLAFGVVAHAQEDAEEVDSPYRPGLIATYSAGGRQAIRVDEAIAFDWGAAATDPRLAAGRITAAWKGHLLTQAGGKYELRAFAAGGKVSLKLGDKELIAGQANEPQWLAGEPLELTFGYQPLEVSFEQTGDAARLALFWSGPNFVLEPIPERFLFHDRESSPSTDFERGRRLASALRCAACHAEVAGQSPGMLAPALDRLNGNVEAAWLVDWLSKEDVVAREGEAVPDNEARDEPTALVRRMPHFGISQTEAADIAAWLLRLPAEKQPPAQNKELEQKAAKNAKKGKGGAAEPTAEEGEKLFLTLGCLACHQHGELGESGLFGGGDLTAVAAKRPAAYFERWLADPASLNRDHRMPVFELSAAERKSLALWLAKQGAAGGPPSLGNAASGAKLVAQHRCGSCHALPGMADAPRPASLKPLAANSDWSHSCAGASNVRVTRPGFGLPAADQTALRTYFTERAKTDKESATSGRDLLVELNCLACHAREGIDRRTNALPARLQDKLNAVVSMHDDLGKLVPAMTPPALNSVGDKLTDAALAAAIRRQDKPHRPYLMVRMPKYNLTEEQLTALTSYLIITDRIPRGAGGAPAHQAAGATPRPPQDPPRPPPHTTDGFGCTSCHQVGSVLPDKAPLNARGPNLSMLVKRIRPEWFSRWCNSPARIVPRMEMPSVQIPVRGVLNDSIDDQLAAVWYILNTPGFEPAEPNPVRVLRLSGVPERKESPIVLHDVIRAGDKTYLFPLVIGLPNRHNILFDLETNRLAAWWLGDTARQRTKGKSWYWEAGGKPIHSPAFKGSEITLVVEGKEYSPRGLNQVQIASLNEYGYRFAAGTYSHYNLTFDLPDGKDPLKLTPVNVVVIQELDPLPNRKHGEFIESGFRRRLSISGVPAGVRIRLRLTDRDPVTTTSKDDNRVVQLPGNGGQQIRLKRPKDHRWNVDSSIDIEAIGSVAPDEQSQRYSRIELEYLTNLPIDQYVAESLPLTPVDPSEVQIAPGMIGRRLALPAEIMPTSLSWRRSDAALILTTLKGQVIIASDGDGDRLEDFQHLICDGLATPYGVLHTDEGVLVATKTGLMAVNQISGKVSVRVLASGWGVTDDYHDWAVGLVPGDRGELYMALPCQQDQRSDVAAKHRGELLRLVPYRSDPIDPRIPVRYKVEVISSGHRFPMGLARNRDGELFVTDNQGNYNPFNELNHVRPGAHFGFINALEKDKGFKPPRLDKPAIDIPHPWTRSVNGICFLETPVGWVKDAQHLKTHAEEARDGASAPRGSSVATAPLTHPTTQTHPTAFGPLEGHLVGCEYDTRQLIRMTLQKVGDTFQGAAYPLSIPPENVEDGLLGPIVCAVSPRSELYVGNIRDSGWGAGNNVGDIVRIKIEPDKLPCGIAEVRATKEGFTLDFFRPVDLAKARDAANYSIASYRRESTPAYGGPNLDRRSEKITAIELAPDANRVTLKLGDLRPGFLYEFQLKPLVRGKELFHPAEAHYTLNQIP